MPCARSFLERFVPNTGTTGTRSLAGGWGDAVGPAVLGREPRRARISRNADRDALYHRGRALSTLDLLAQGITMSSDEQMIHVFKPTHIGQAASLEQLHATARVEG